MDKDWKVAQRNRNSSSGWKLLYAIFSKHCNDITIKRHRYVILSKNHFKELYMFFLAVSVKVKQSVFC